MTLLTEEQIETYLERLRLIPEFTLLPWQEQAVRYLLGKQPGDQMIMSGTRWGRSGIDRAMVKILEAEGFVKEQKDHYILWSKPEPRPEEGIRGIVTGQLILDEVTDFFVNGKPMEGVKKVEINQVSSNPKTLFLHAAEIGEPPPHIQKFVDEMSGQQYHYRFGGEKVNQDMFDATDHDLNIWRQIGSPMKDGKIDLDAIRHVPRKKSASRYPGWDEVDIPKVLADNARLQEKQKNQKKELQRLNTVIRLQSSDIDNYEKRCKRYLADVNRQTRETIRYSGELTHEKAVSSYWHNKFKDLKKKGKK